MKRVKWSLRLLPALAAVCLVWPPTTASAQAASSYSYTVTIYAGNQGSFDDSVRLFVDHTRSGNTSGSTAEITDGQVTVGGLKKDDIITVDLQTDSIQLGQDSRYYVKGIRQSGRDNNTVATSVFQVDRDADYVVAYGVKGDMVAYTVNYQDADGNELAPSNTYYGNVGDKPVVAYQYIEGYEPEVLAMTKTLVENEAENVFTFIYHQTGAGMSGQQTGTSGTTIISEIVPGSSITETSREVLPGTSTTSTTSESLPGTSTTSTTSEVLPGTSSTTTTDDVVRGAGTTATAGTAGGGAADVPAGGGEAVTAEDEGGGEAAAAEDEGGGEAAEEPALAQVDDQEVPLAEQDLQNLDDEEVPASDIQLDSMVKKGLPLAASIGIALAAVAAIVILVFILIKKHKEKKGADFGKA